MTKSSAPPNGVTSMEHLPPGEHRRYLGGDHGDQPACPKHGPRFQIRPGTNRCPLGRKRKVNCR